MKKLLSSLAGATDASKELTPLPKQTDDEVKFPRNTYACLQLHKLN